MLIKLPKPKLCKVCGQSYAPRNTLQRVCSPGCALVAGRRKVAQEAQKQAKAEKRAGLERLKTRRDWLKEVQVCFNRWKRLHDLKHYGPYCTACGRQHQGQWHAGHLRSVGSNPALRFEPDNVWLTCAPCNTHLSGNLLEMRANLAKRLSPERMAWLEGPHEPKKYTVDQLIEMKKHYSKLARELQTN